MAYLHKYVLIVAFLLVAGCVTFNIDSNIDHLILKGKQTEALKLVNQQIKENEDDHALYYQKSKIYFSLEEYNKAIEAINHSLILKPGIPEYRLEAGKNYYYNKDYFNSINQFKSAILMDADLIRAYYYLALSYNKVGKTEEAQEYLGIVIGIEPLFFDALLLQSELKYKTIQTDAEALTQILEVSEILKLNPNSIVGNILLSDLYFQTGNLFKAEELIENLLKVKENNRELIVKLANLYIRSGLYHQADDLINRFQGRDKTIDILAIRIDYFTQKNPGFDAELSQLLREFPENSELHFIQGLKFFNQKEYAPAESSFQKVLSLKPEFAEAYLYLSKISELQKDTTSEKFYIEKAFSISPQNSDVLLKYLEMTYYLGDMIALENVIENYDPDLSSSFSKFYQALIYKTKGDYTNALSLLKQLSTSVYSFKVETQLADMDIEKGYYHSAEKKLSLVLKESPDLLDAILTKAKLLFRTQKIQEVIAFLKPYIMTPKAKGAIHILLSDALIQTGQLEKAMEVLKSGFDIWPEHVEIAQLLSLLLETQKQYQAAIKILVSLQSFEHKFNQLFHYRLIGLYLKTGQQEKMQEYLLRHNIKKELSFQNSYLSNFIFKRLNTCNKPKEKAD